MLADVQAHFGLKRPFHGVGNYETEHQRTLVREVCVLLQAKPAEVRDFLAGTLAVDRTRELTEQLRVAGVPL